MQEIFRENTTRYNFRNNEFFQPRVRSVSNGTESIRFKGPATVANVTTTNTEFRNPLSIKNKIKNWYGENCSCKLCRIFIPNLGHL